MPRLVPVLAPAIAALLCSACAADVKFFKFQEAWWSAGKTCIASRDPPGRRGHATTPRACRAVEAAQSAGPSVHRGGTAAGAL